MTVEPLDLAQVDLRAEPDALPFDAPAANTAATWEGRDVLWLGPDEWLIVGEPGTEDAIVDELESALADQHRSVVAVGANRIVFDVIDGRDRLAGACGLDLHPDHWSAGMCAQTLFGQAQVILLQRDERTTRVFVRPSFAGYVEALLATA
ncbi:MAG TPA: sarcosine oxidase subunit gamma family protein [Actinomycetota bacterium]|nr:sarcosine oxidase subunit gamma family protein [Actinomycetota bacterium]